MTQWTTRDKDYNLITATIPHNYPYYVTCQDNFMSGWGLAENKCNICVIPCRDHWEAERVMRYINKHREECTEPSVSEVAPPTNPEVLYSDLTNWIEVSQRQEYAR